MKKFIREYWIPFLVFVVFSLCIVVKALYIPDCFAFDPNDDRNHTFVNLFASREILTAGALPQMNFFNNFGTPILGDALTYPFALQALTYTFLDGPLAMTVNRFLIALATLFMVWLIYKRFFDRWLAILLSLFAFSAPGFLWHFAHHHYQMALLCAASLLCVLVYWSEEKLNAKLALALLYCIAVITTLSVSIQVVLIIFFFVIAASFLLPRKRSTHAPALPVVMILTAAAATTLPQTYAFIKAISSSTRAQAIYVAGTAYEHYTVLHIALGSLIQARMGGGHIDVALYLSLPLLLALSVGIVILFREKSSLAKLALILGFVPLIAVYGLISMPGVWAHIPLLKSTDITRIWWISTLFLAFPIGIFFNNLVCGRLHRSLGVLLLILTGATLAGLFFWYGACALSFRTPLPCGSNGIVQPIHLVNLVLFFLLLLYSVAQTPRPIQSKRRDPVLFAGSILLLPLLILPNFLSVLQLSGTCQGGHYFGLLKSAVFQPQALLELMEPFHRVASELPSSSGLDLTAIFHKVLGSNGRSIIMNDAFTRYLQQEGLIAIDDHLGGYHFTRPWQTIKLELLGIRYIIAQGISDELIKDGWKLLASRDGVFLYENKKRPTPFYLTRASKVGPADFLRSYSFSGNEARIDIPDDTSARIFTAAFAARDGWIASLDGYRVPLIARNDHLLHIAVPTGKHTLRISFSPFQ